LGALATVPLLLIGLVTLALRGQILPRTRTDIYDQLVRILLEVHPTSRATASGATEPRFRHATDPIQRRAAIARLAFAVREQTGGAGMLLPAAREILRTYLASPQGFDLAEADAAAAADEILSVNSETQGLIIEKARGVPRCGACRRLAVQRYRGIFTDACRRGALAQCHYQSSRSHPTAG
jgi:hypothetical protein